MFNWNVLIGRAREDAVNGLVILEESGIQLQANDKIKLKQIARNKNLFYSMENDRGLTSFNCKLTAII